MIKKYNYNNNNNKRKKKSQFKDANVQELCSLFGGPTCPNLEQFRISQSWAVNFNPPWNACFDQTAIIEEPVKLSTQRSRSYVIEVGPHDESAPHRNLPKFTILFIILLVCSGNKEDQTNPYQSLSKRGAKDREIADATQSLWGSKDTLLLRAFQDQFIFHFLRYYSFSFSDFIYRLYRIHKPQFFDRWFALEVYF